MNIPDDLKYSEDHEWVRVEGNVATVGITDYAQDALGDIVFVELPEVGAATKTGETLSEVESTKSVSDIFAPLTGTITEVNGTLDGDPAVVNSDPYGAGWMFKVEMSNPEEVDALMTAEAYGAFTAE